MLLLLLAFTAILIYYYLTLKFDYWKVRGIAFIKPIPFFGNFYDAMLLRKSMGDTLQDIYNSKDMKGQRCGGVFLGREPVLMIKDPDVINQVLVKDFEYFSDRGFNEGEIMNDHLLVSKGERWRTFRKIFVQNLTSGRLLTMTDKLLDETENILKSNMEIFSKQVACFSIKAMLLCLFGKNEIPDDKVILKLKQFLTPSYKNVFINVYPKVSKIIGLTSNKQNFYQNLLQESISNQNYNDFIQSWKKFENNDETVAAQVFTFLLGSLNTYGLFMSILRELILNPNVMAKLDEEMNTINREKIRAEDIKSMKYLNKVIFETLRKYSNGVLVRTCVKDYQLEGLRIEKGTNIIIPVSAVHYNPLFYPKPDVFDPERFSGVMNPCRFLSFGAGPRKCPGFQLIIMHVKVVLVSAWNRIPFKELKSAKWNISRVGDLGLPLTKEGLGAVKITAVRVESIDIDGAAIGACIY